MKPLMPLMIWMGASLAAAAQTNYPALYLPSTAPAQIRPLSLRDCIELTLRNNMTIQVQRYNPVLAYHALRAQYGAYDPSFALSGTHRHDEAGTEILGAGFAVPGSEVDADTFNGGLSGLLPWGTSYTLAGTTTDREGKNFGLGTNNTVIPEPFEYSSGQVTLAARQPLLKNFWIDSTRLSIRVSRNNLARSELGLKASIMDQVTLLEQAYYGLILRRENVKVQEKAVELANQLVQENRKRVEVGALAPLEERQAEAQAAAMLAALIQARSDLAVQENLLKSLITDDYAQWAGAVLEPTVGLEAVPHTLNLHESWGRGLTRRPELLQARLDAESAGIRLKYSRNQLFPQLDVFGTYGYNGSGTEFYETFRDIGSRDRPTYSVGGAITVPLGHTEVRNNHKYNKVLLQQTLATMKQLEQGIMTAIDNDIKVVTASFEQVTATRAARTYAEEALAAEQKKKLDSGKSTTYVVLQMQRDLTTTRAAEIQALAVYNQSLAQLSRDEGSTFERLGIVFEIN